MEEKKPPESGKVFERATPLMKKPLRTPPKPRVDPQLGTLA
jgi:hypothetical protein